MSTRRQFLINCSAAALTVAATPAILAGSREDAGVASIDFDLSTFERELGTNFSVSLMGDTSVGLQLVRAESYQPNRLESVPAPDAANERFSLLFQGPRSRPLGQDTYRFTHAKLGRFDMFIVPIGPPDPQSRCYEAIFNRAMGSKLTATRNSSLVPTASRASAGPRLVRGKLQHDRENSRG